jgi:hypothetical protein
MGSIGCSSDSCSISGSDSVISESCAHTNINPIIRRKITGFLFIFPLISFWHFQKNPQEMRQKNINDTIEFE